MPEKRFLARIFAAFLLVLAAALPIRAAEIEAQLAYYGTLASGNLFKEGETLQRVYGQSNLRVIVTDNLNGHNFQSNGTGTCPGSGNAFCFDLVVRNAAGTEIDRVVNATSDWQVKTGNVTDGFAVVDPANPGMGFFVVVPNRTNPVTGSETRYTVRGSSDPFEATDANAVVTFLDPAPVITAPGASAGAASSIKTLAENTAAVGSFTASESVTWSLSGTDAALFTIDASGALRFRQAPDYEAPGDGDRNNSYLVTVTATDSGANTATHALTVTVGNTLEGRISGTVTDRSGTPVAGATVRLLSGGNVLSTATSDASGAYAFIGLASGTYSLEFLPRSGRAVKARNQRGTMNGRFTEGLVISSEQAVANADAILVDPAGVVYDSDTRQPLSGVQIGLYRNGALVPNSELDTGAGGQNPQTTSAAGEYSFILNGSASSGTYTLVVTAPSGYAFESSAIPPSAPSYTPALGGGVEAIQTQSTAPQGAEDTEYYLAFDFIITSASATTSNGVVNNHIPLDPVTGAASGMVLTATPATLTADGTSASALLVQLKDGDGNDYPASGGTVTLAATAGTLGTVTDNGDGTYAATLTAPTATGTATVTATLGSGPISDSTDITFVAGAADAGTTTLTASPDSITADGVTSSTLTLQAKDANGNDLTTGGATITLATTAGTLGTVTDNGDGTYTAELTSATQAGTAAVTGELDGQPIADDATITFVAGAADAGTTTLTASPDSVTADGVTSSTLTVQAKDANGNDLTTGGATVVLATTAGTLGTVTDNGDGTYTAELTSATQAGTAAVTGELDGQPIADDATITFVAGAADPGTTTLTASPDSITADGVTSSTLTVQAKDSNGNDLTTGGATITLATTAGTLGAVTDNGDGTYTAELTSATQAGTAAVTGELDGQPIADDATVTFVDRTSPALTGPSDGGGSVTDAPFATRVPEGTTAVTQITASETIDTWALSGEDAAQFDIDAGGNITFDPAPDYEEPADGDGDNVYVVVVEATDGAANTARQDLQVTVTDVLMPGTVADGQDDADGDGVADLVESATEDRDGDGIPDRDDYDPQGYFYCAEDGRILTGGRVTITGPGNVNLVKDGESTGEYQWFVDRPGTYVMAIDTTGMEFPVFDTPSAGTFVVATGTTDPIILGATQSGSSGYLGNYLGRPHDPAHLTTYYTTFVIAEGDKDVFGNNIPFADCASGGATVTATANGREPDEGIGAAVEFLVTLDRPSTSDTVVDYSVSGSATPGADYVPLSGRLTIPAGDTSATLRADVREDDRTEGAETVQITLTALSGDSATELSGMPTATALIAEDLLDEVRTAVKRVLEEDLEQTLARQSRQFSDLSRGALGHLQAEAQGAEAGAGAQDRCGTLRAFDVDGSAQSNSAGLTASGQFGDETYDCTTRTRRFSYGDFSLQDVPSQGLQGLLTFGRAREVAKDNRIAGVFAGGYLSQSAVASGDATGQILGAGVNAGRYGAAELREGLFLDWYGAAALGYHRYALTVDGLSADGDYAYAAVFAGAALSGMQSYGALTVTPRMGIDFAQAYATRADIRVTGPGGWDDGQIVLDPATGLRVYVEAGFAFGAIPGEGGPRSGFTITPRLLCQTGFGADTSGCGAGLSLALKGDDVAGLVSWEVAVDAEMLGSTQRVTVGIDRRRDILGGAGTLATGLHAGTGGEPTLNQSLELRW